MGALLMGLVGFGLGLFFGWMLQRERVSGTGHGDRTTAALADTSARLELADQDVIDLRAQLTDAQHLLDERAATIAQLESELMAYRDRSYDEEIVAEPDGVDEMDTVTDEIVDAAADVATAPDTPLTASQFDLDEADVTDEVLVPRDVAEVELADEVVADEVVAEVVVEEPPVEVAPIPPAEVAEVELADEVVAEEPEPVEAEQPDVAEAPVDGVLLDGAAATAPAAASTAASPSGDTSDERPFPPSPDAERDDLRRIRGIGPTMERLLNEQGIVTFRQLAVLDAAAIQELQRRLPGVSGRIRRGQWIEQARDLHVETHGDQP